MCSGWVQGPRAHQEKVYNKRCSASITHHSLFFTLFLSFGVTIYLSRSAQILTDLEKKMTLRVIRDFILNCSTFEISSPVAFCLNRLLFTTLYVSVWDMVHFYFICNLITFPLYQTVRTFPSFSFQGIFRGFLYHLLHMLVIPSLIFICSFFFFISNQWLKCAFWLTVSVWGGCVTRCPCVVFGLDETSSVLQFVPTVAV